eukprot:scaffold110399_cov38-Prasinocladus_malaysianus.AAC.2
MDETYRNVFKSCRDGTTRCEAEIIEEATEAGKMKLMAFLENSPVLCAYGLSRSGCFQHPKVLGYRQPLSLAAEQDSNDVSQAALDGLDREAGGVVLQPIALEWDLWIDPKAPQRLDLATIDHGSVTALVQQAVLKGAGCISVAGYVGQVGSPAYSIVGFGAQISAVH